MSYAMTHLIIACNYIEKHRFTPEERALFLLASFSPDSVHARRDYNPHMKERSHFLPEGIAWGMVYEEEPMNRMYEATAEFYRGRKRESAPLELAFLKGYTMHLLVDIYNCKLVYAPNLIRFGGDVAGFRGDYRQQCMNFDNYLYQHFAGRDELFRVMEQGLKLLEENPVLEGLKLGEWINREDIGATLYDMEKMYREYPLVSPESVYMLTPDSSRDFIDEVGRQCGELLFDFPAREGLFRVEGGRI